MNRSDADPHAGSAETWSAEQAVRDRLLAELDRGGDLSRQGNRKGGQFEAVAPIRSARRAAGSGSAKPISFSATLVRAILAGNKTETRRPIRPQPVRLVRWRGKDRPADAEGAWLECPLAEPGTMLWVREPWAPADSGSGFRYLADLGPDAGKKVKWQPGRFMPARAARLQLSVVHVFPQRLAEMTAVDASREGAPVSLDGEADPVAWFSNSWDRLYAAADLGFDRNPWVWTVRFRLYSIHGQRADLA